MFDHRDSIVKKVVMINAEQRNKVFKSLARLLNENREQILEANRADIDAFANADMVLLDRAKVDDKKIDGMITAIEKVMAAKDKVGEVISSYIRNDGLRIENRRVPFGTILIIFEARPDVCIEAAAIALKAGNSILLKGGKESRNTNLVLCQMWEKALAENEVDTTAVRYLDLSREETQTLIAGKAERIDLIIPRGGEGLIRYITENADAPVLVSGRGNNFLYIHSEADTDMAVSIALNGKSRLSVCNALDKVLIDRNLPNAGAFVERLSDEFKKIGIEVFGDEDVAAIEASIQKISGDDIWYEEFLAPKIVFGLVDDADAAIEKINKYSGGHSAAIVTADDDTAERFLQKTDCSAVYHNASTRFTDGGEFGLGAEIAISTQKLHARGPLGADHLMTNKWFVTGNGQVR